MSAATEYEIIGSFLAKVAGMLDLRVEELPLDLSREQIARIAGLKNARCLASSAERGVKRSAPRWLAFRATVGLGIHKVPTLCVARWLAICATALPMPAPAPAEEDAAATLGSALGRIVRCGG
jgi:hypothetical protein